MDELARWRTRLFSCGLLSALLAALGYGVPEALKRGALSRSSPYVALSPAFSVIGGLWLLDEQPSVGLLLGLAAIVVGAFGLYPKSVTPEEQAHQQPRCAIILMVCVALVWSLSGVLDKLGLTFVSGQLYFILHSVLTLLLLITYAVFKRTRVELPGTESGRLFLVGVSSPPCKLSILAYDTLQVAIVEAIKRVGGLVGGVIFGYVVFSERVGVREGLCIVAWRLGCGPFWLRELPLIQLANHRRTDGSLSDNPLHLRFKVIE